MFAQLPVAAKTTQSHNQIATLMNCVRLIWATSSNDAYAAMRADDATLQGDNAVLSVVLYGSRFAGEFPRKQCAHRWRCRP